MIISINEVIKSRLPVGLVNLHCVQYFMSYECKKFNMKWDSCAVAAALRSTATGLMFPPNIKHRHKTVSHAFCSLDRKAHSAIPVLATLLIQEQ